MKKLFILSCACICMVSSLYSMQEKGRDPESEDVIRYAQVELLKSTLKRRIDNKARDKIKREGFTGPDQWSIKNKSEKTKTNSRKKITKKKTSNPVKKTTKRRAS